MTPDLDPIMQTIAQELAQYEKLLGQAHHRCTRTRVHGDYTIQHLAETHTRIRSTDLLLRDL